MFESRTDPLAPRHIFLRRFAKCFVSAIAIILFALTVGVLGYHYLAGFTWIDALLDAAMILSGMGPVGELQTEGAKVFAAAYALFSGLVFIGIMGLLLAPVAHRALHHFHLDENDPD